MKYEVFHDTLVPCMYACVPLKSVLLGNHSLLFLQKLWLNDTSLEFFKKNPIGTEFRGIFYFAQKWVQWAKKWASLVFSGNNLK